VLHKCKTRVNSTLQDSLDVTGCCFALLPQEDTPHCSGRQHTASAYPVTRKHWEPATWPVMVGRGLPAPTANSEPCVSLSISHGSSVHEPLSLGTPLGAITHPRSLTHAPSELDFHPVFSTLRTPCVRSACHKTQTHPVPVSSRAPTLRQPIPGITLGLCFLGHPTPPGLTAWSPAPASPERAPGGLLRSVCPFSVTLGWYYTPCPTSRVDTMYARTTWPVETNPLLGLPTSQFGRLVITTLLTYLRRLSIVTCLGRSPLSASSLSPFRPCTPTFDNQSPAAGRCCHSSTWRVGVDDSPSSLTSPT
jgi:hypothetical protein